MIHLVEVPKANINMPISYGYQLMPELLIFRAWILVYVFMFLHISKMYRAKSVQQIPKLQKDLSGKLT